HSSGHDHPRRGAGSGDGGGPGHQRAPGVHPGVRPGVGAGRSRGGGGCPLPGSVPGTVHYQICGEGHPLLFISGVGYGGWFWHKQVPMLSQHFQVITFDNRGAGGTDKPDGPYTTAQMAGDTVGLLEALGIELAHVVGHSLGGFIAQELVLSRPELVSRLVLASTTYGGPNVIPITPEALEVLTRREGDPVELVRRGIAIATAPGFAGQKPEVVQELIRYRLTNPVPPAQYQAQVMAGATHNAEARIGQIRCPTLILFGEHDRVVPPGNAELLARKIPDAQVMILPGVGHIFPIEDLEATNSALLEFLKEL
ncbi:MAG TPA: alpha/beta fold hydrolase, partial [Anaerolineae bacterium]|nr:alpha/beta fold hydrolase [Anaerolineae bacterium]